MDPAIPPYLTRHGAWSHIVYVLLPGSSLLPPLACAVGGSSGLVAKPRSPLPSCHRPKLSGCIPRALRRSPHGGRPPARPYSGPPAPAAVADAGVGCSGFRPGLRAGACRVLGGSHPPGPPASGLASSTCCCPSTGARPSRAGTISTRSRSGSSPITDGRQNTTGLSMPNAPPAERGLHREVVR